MKKITEEICKKVYSDYNNGIDGKVRNIKLVMGYNNLSESTVRRIIRAKGNLKRYNNILGYLNYARKKEGK